MAADRVRRRVLVTGRVQGVWFRESCRDQAQAAGVAGWVRNLADGRVEVVGEGPEEVLAEFEGTLRQGPSFSSVSAVDRSPIEPRGDRGFHVR